MPVLIQPYSAAETLAACDAICAVYGAAFAAPPYARGPAATAAFADTLTRHVGRQAFRCRVARDGASGAILGFAYGYPSAPGHWWHDLVARALGSDQSRRWLADAFELVELALWPTYQGQGIGGRLHDALLVEVAQPVAVLSTRQEETAALALYRRRGWTALRRDFHFSGGAAPWMIMGLDLARRRPAVRRVEL
ncbi:MAG: GNAT family N-acetyltransferase [Chloroflexota bacterium]|nr:GNAT family N-acetyltransferase [Chloroflexota bacterium]